MKMHTLYLAVAGVCASFSAYSASIELNDDIKLDWGMDAYVRSHVIEPGEGDTENGFTSHFGINANLLLNDGWSVHTRLQGYYDWAGDRRHSGGAGTNYTSGENVDGLSLDLGYAQYFNDGLLIRAGRQRADWAYGFNIQNDRRDRLLAMKSYGYGQENNVSVLGIYDLRFSESGHDSAYDVYHDVNMYALAAIGKHGVLDWGILWAYFDGDEANIGNASASIPQQGYGIDYFHNISPFFKVGLSPVELKGAVNVILSDSKQDNGYYTTWGSDGYSGFLEATYKVTSDIKLQVQGVGFIDGGLVGRGFDTYSGLINNSDRNNPSPISRQFFGGLGHENNDGQIYAARMDWQVANDWNVKFAGGHISIDNTLGGGENIEAIFVDLKTQYQWSKYTDFEVQMSWANENIDDLALMAVVNIKYN
ncbi:hypothetical protein CGI23_23925 [Vibrio parahaemolyticus]|uniref:hypothetical protein n=1 Tax=Vibrio parahaemolyticus TaxID=670 RepID=UPI00111E7ECC|nr:hypothetical protein [Vibrio parahaemolyticus]TOK18525.1 hypothetical protein CGI23_23925 [Vibrio parahaemolyticus]